MVNIVSPGEHDALCGRGGHTIHWSGNIKFRALVEQHRDRYLNASRVDKGKVVAEVVQMWRKMSPPGRFLTLTEPKIGDASPWHDIGDKLAQKKTAKRLREGHPETLRSGSNSSVSSSSSDADSSRLDGVNTLRKREIVRRVSSDTFALEKAAKRARIDYEFEQIPRVHLMFEDQLFSQINKELELDGWGMSPDLLAEAELDLDDLLKDPVDEPITLAKGLNETVEQFNDSWLSTSMNSYYGGSVLDELAISIPSAACLTEAILFD